MDSWFLGKNQQKYKLTTVGALALLTGLHFSGFRFSRVRGYCMHPAIHHGDIIFEDGFFGYEDRLEVGDIVTLKNPEKEGKLVKRLMDMDNSGGFYWVEGDNHYWISKEGEIMCPRDSKKFGAVKDILRKVLFVYCPHEGGLKFDL